MKFLQRKRGCKYLADHSVRGHIDGIFERGWGCDGVGAAILKLQWPAHVEYPFRMEAGASACAPVVVSLYPYRPRGTRLNFRAAFSLAFDRVGHLNDESWCNFLMAIRDVRFGK